MSVNNVTLVGRLGASPELRSTGSGKAVCSFRLATNRWDPGQSTETADWHTVVAWERTAENCHRYLDKGSQVAVEGRLTTRSWEGRDGKKRSKTEVMAHRVAFLSSRDGERGDGRRGASQRPHRADDDLPF